MNKYLLIFIGIIIITISFFTLFPIPNKTSSNTYQPLVNQKNNTVTIQPSSPTISSQNQTNSKKPSTEISTNSSNLPTNPLIIFHNGTGPMCKQAIRFLKNNKINYIEFLPNNSNYSSKMNEYKAQYPQSIGESKTYAFLPLIFYKDSSFSGFNQEVEKEIIRLSNL